MLFEFDGDVNAIRHVLYNCSASRPSIESQTKEETIKPGTETLTLTADPRPDGLVKARTGDTTDDTTYVGWYGAVYEVSFGIKANSFLKIYFIIIQHHLYREIIRRNVNQHGFE